MCFGLKQNKDEANIILYESLSPSIYEKIVENNNDENPLR